MRRDPCAVRPARSNDDPTRDSKRIPTAALDDLPGKSDLPIERPDEFVDVRDVGLELDDQQRSVAGVPGDDVDHAALRVDREGDFGGELPLRQRFPEPGSDRVVQRGVPSIEESIEVASPPSSKEVDPNIECVGDDPHGPERQGVEMAALDTGHGRVRNAGTRREITLPPAPALPDRSDGRAQPRVIHSRSVGGIALLALI